ncbi:MAG: helix-turn-helix domain-containing protein [Thermodesulfobacteriota bacterium]
MAKFETIIKSEMVRLAKREMRKIAVPLGRDVRSTKSVVSQLRKSVLTLQRIAASQQKELEKGKKPLEAAPEEVKISRFSPRLIRSLRSHLGITQKELAILTDVTVGAVHQWESGQFKPSMKKKAAIVALRKLGRREIRKLLEDKAAQKQEKKSPSRRRKRTKKIRRK